jgi:hypothetical protein
MAPVMMSGSLLAIDAISWALTRAVMLSNILSSRIIGLLFINCVCSKKGCPEVRMTGLLDSLYILI